MKLYGHAFTFLLVWVVGCLIEVPDATAQESSDANQRPNVVLIAVDDLNDWIGCLGGHPQAQTPGFDKLAAKGVLFTNAHCQSPVCNPSRASLMTSLFPSSSGIYFLDPDLAKSPISTNNTLLPKRFQNEGFQVSGAGKLFHGGQNKKYWPNWNNFGGAGWPRQAKKLTPFPGHPLWDWGVIKERDEDSPDYKIASWTVDALKNQKADQPFLIGTGFVRPHVPQYASQKWFDMYPLETVQLPKYRKDDLKDLSSYAIDITRLKHVAPTHEWVLENDQWKPLVQSYLACVSFVDSQVERVVDAIENSPHKDNTYIVLFSDHGFHLGEKDRYAKRSLWQDSTRVPMMIAGPGIKPGVCDAPVQLMDIYPTLLELCKLSADEKLEGHSLQPLLKNPKADWDHYARCSFGPGNYAIVSKQYRYVHYNDGSQEFYDNQSDPHEWKNLINEKSMASIIEQHRSQIPKERHVILGKRSTGHLSFEATEAKLVQPAGQK
ncbi:MAG: sulfatase [Planctomycetota bacterium]